MSSFSPLPPPSLDEQYGASKIELCTLGGSSDESARGFILLNEPLRRRARGAGALIATSCGDGLLEGTREFVLFESGVLWLEFEEHDIRTGVIQQILKTAKSICLTIWDALFM